MKRRLTLVVGCIVAALLALVMIVAGCGESGSGEPEAADTSLAAASFEDTFGERPDACEAGYGVWETGLTYEEHDVTYCYSGRMSAGHPSNTGCYITDTGQDITIGFREVNDDTSLC